MKKTFLLLLFPLLAQSGDAKTIYVNKNLIGGANDGTAWGSAFKKISLALEVAEYGDEIWVAKGLYEADLISARMVNGVKLYGGFLGTETTLGERDWAQNQTIVSRNFNSFTYKFLYCKGTDSTTTVDGLVFQHGATHSFDNDGACLFPSEGNSLCTGGAIFIYSPHKDTLGCLRVLNCVFRKNSGYYGGAIELNLAGGSGGLVVENCRFEENYSGNGAINITTSSWPQWRFEVRDVVFYRNGANFFGAPAISFSSYNFDAFLEVERVLFEENKSVNFSGTGAVSAWKGSGARSQFRHCVFRNNDAGTNQFVPGVGGAMLLTGGFVSDCIFEGNRAYIAGAMRTARSTVVNSLFVNNEAFYRAGAIETSGSAYVINCTFLNNVSHNQSCFWNIHQSGYYYNNLFLNNSTLDDSPLFELTGTLEIAHCAFDALDTIGLFHVRPLASLNFSPDNLMGISPLLRPDYRHPGCSPLIDAGDTVFLANLGILTDFGGSPRVLGDNVDIGAFETPSFQAAADWADAGCFGLANGSATLWAEGGIPPYSFRWDGLPNDSVRTDLPAGTHTAIVLDSDLCADTFLLEIGQSAPILLAATVGHSSNYQSFDGSIAVDSVWSGIPPFSFHWSTGSTTNAITGLAPGPYTLSVTDAQGCTDTWVFEVMSASGVAEMPERTLLVVPNPSSGLFEVRLPQRAGGALMVYNTHGQMLRVQTIAADASKVSLELGAFPNGLYWIVLFNEAGEMLGTAKVSIVH